MTLRGIFRRGWGRRARAWGAAGAAVLSAAALPAAEPFAWQADPPAAHGLDAGRLDRLRDHLAAHRTKAFLLIHDDRMVYEWYAPDHGVAQPHFTASMAKALVGGMAVAVALQDGRLGLDDPAARFVPAWRGDPVKSRITLRQLGSHTSGLDDAKDGDVPHPQLTGWRGDFWKRLPPPRDPFTLARDVVPVVVPPESRLLYSNPGIALLAYATTAALAGGAEKDLRTLLRARILRPIGVADSEWSVGYGQTVTVDGLPLVGTWGGGAFTARATARIARLLLREGDWDGRALLRPEVVRAVTADPRTGGSGGIGWWGNHAVKVGSLPRDAFWAGGAQHQIALVIPSRRVIVIRNGGALSQEMDYDRARDELFFQPVMDALRAKP